MADRRHWNRHARPRDCWTIDEQNDQRTDELGSKVKLLKCVALQIGEETKRQITHLTGYEQAMDLTKSLVDRTRRRVVSLSRSGSWRISLYLMFFSLFVFLLIYFLIK